MTAASDVPGASASAPSAWAPLGRRVFAVIWLATLLANIGTWVREVGAAWLMTTMSPSATAVALVQVATALPIFLLSLPAGALADIVNRRRLLIGIQLALVVIMLGLGVAVDLGIMTPTTLLLGLAAAGVGVALAQPVQQSLTPRLVERALLRPAIALNSLGVNVARAIGPALGGGLVLWWGVASTFYVDAFSYLGLIVALWWWKGAAQPASVGPPEQLGPALRAGLRYAWHAPALKRVLLRSAAYFLFASAFWALLPLIARRQLGGGPALYGVMLACVGAGAVAGAIALPALRARLSAEAVVRLGSITTIVVLALLAAVRQPAAAALAMALVGAAWIAVLTTVNVAAQVHLPDWVRGRGLALNLTVFYGSMSFGSLLWGQLVDLASIPAALASAAVLGAATLWLAWRRPLPPAEPDLSPSGHWPRPEVTPEVLAMLERDDAPVLVTVEYRIARSSVAEFLQAVRQLSLERLRDGAWHWGVYTDIAQPGLYIESFVLPSWREHERQHDRVTRSDADLQARVQALHIGADPPRVRHHVAV